MQKRPTHTGVEVNFVDTQKPFGSFCTVNFNAKEITLIIENKPMDNITTMAFDIKSLLPTEEITENFSGSEKREYRIENSSDNLKYTCIYDHLKNRSDKSAVGKTILHPKATYGSEINPDAYRFLEKAIQSLPETHEQIVLINRFKKAAAATGYTQTSPGAFFAV